MDLDSKMTRTTMESVHPLAPARTPIVSATVVKKVVKGTPISVPTNGRRLSTFSVKSANRSLMTGYRDGGSGNARRKSSASSQGHQSPPFVPHKDDFDVIGTVPGFEKLVEAEANKHNKGKLRVSEFTAVSDDIEHNGPLSNGEDMALLTPTSPSLSPSTPTVTASQQLIKAGTSFSRLKHINGFGKNIKAAPTSWQQMPLPCVRIWPTAEFTGAGMTVQFVADRFSITIRRNSTKIPHAELKCVNYYTASSHKIFQFATFSKLAESSLLAKHYDPTANPENPQMINLFIDTSSSSILRICHNLKQKGIEIKRLTPEAAEDILASNFRRPSTSRMPEQPEETLFVYPFNSSVKSRSIAVRAEDAARLEKGEFLNDTIIEFGLKYAQANAEKKNVALSGQVYIFNTFFYQRLVAKPPKGMANSYEAIRSWTAKTDIFSMKYIIVPIHEKLHWYLAIITNPGLLLQKSRSNSSISSSSEPDTISGDITMQSSEEMMIDTEPPKGLKAGAINVEEKPYIICLDSLGGSHPSVFGVLRSYLQQELLSRKGIAMTLTSKEITGKFSSKCPKQDNLWDCGVYLLHYAEVFLRSPTILLDAIVNRTDDKSLWSLNELATKRAKYKEIVSSLTEQYRVYKFHRDLVDDIKGKSNDKCAQDLKDDVPTEVVKKDCKDASSDEAPVEQNSEQTTDALKIAESLGK
ncbi:hypothetical protein BGZ46_007782 [Entomortierella lignicola]|nr:hypothetical protein BGZ46_007782 [Entomortierella lignicola]